PGFLQPSVRVEQLRADEPGCRLLLKYRQHRVEPTWKHDRVVVEEHENFAMRQVGSPIAATEKTEVRFVALEAYAGDIGKRGRGGFRRSVVLHQDFVAPHARVLVD